MLTDFVVHFKTQPFSTIWGETRFERELLPTIEQSESLKEGRCEEDGHEGEGYEGEGHEEANEKSHEGECNRQGQASKIFCLAREEGKDIHWFEEGHGFFEMVFFWLFPPGLFLKIAYIFEWVCTFLNTRRSLSQDVFNYS